MLRALLGFNSLIAKNMRGYVQILGTATVDTTPSLLVFFDNQRYLFDVGEGTQRFCLEHKVKLSRIDNIFLTRLTWEQLGGLPGMILTVSDVGTTSLRLAGPTGLLSFLTSTRYFLQRPGFQLEVNEFHPTSPKPYQDEFLRAIPVLINPNSPSPSSPFSSSSSTSPSSTIPSSSSISSSSSSSSSPSPSPAENLVSIYYPSTRPPPPPSAAHERAQHVTLTKTVVFEGGEKELRNNDVAEEGVGVTPIALNYLHSSKARKNRLSNSNGAVSNNSNSEDSKPEEKKENEKEEKKKNEKKETENGKREGKRQKRKRLEEIIDVVKKNQTKVPENNTHSFTYPSDTVVCYICKSPDIPGKFDPKKATELGIPMGPLFGELQKGKTVVSPKTGAEVRSDQCMGKATPGPIFIVVQCPSLSYVPNITQNESFSLCYAGPEQVQPVSFIIHVTAHEALETDEYKNWLRKFGDKTEHIIINKEVCTHNFVFCATAENQYNLNNIEPSIFPQPHHRSTGKNLPSGLPTRSHRGENLMQLHFAPVSKQGIDKSEVLKADDSNCLRAMKVLNAVPDYSELLEKYKTWKKNEFKIEAKNEHDPTLVFLGTGSAIPSKYRNVTGIYFEPVPNHGMMLDAGEGSYGQLFRKFGDKVDQVISNLKMVWISHIHADHHLGLIRILANRALAGVKTPLKVVGPKPVGMWLAEYAHIQPLNYEFVDCAEVKDPNSKIKDFLLENFGFTTFFNIEVLHCPDAYALIVVHKNGWKLVYSGDTRPCPQLEVAGADATVLIHEATLEEGMEEDARDKGHSTTKQAVDSGVRMRANSILLTHFSQRYPKIPNLDQMGHSAVGVAFDLMSVNWANLPLLPKVLPPLTRVFDEEEIEKEQMKEKNREKMAEEKKTKKGMKNKS